MSSPRHHAWFNATERDIADQYIDLHTQARNDIQRSGHGGEGTWASLLNQWLPNGYEADTRKYILPEEGPDSDAFETDLVVFNPRYPRHLRDKHEVLAGGVAAAFSCKLTLDAAGIADGVRRAALLRRQLKPRGRSVRSELLGAFPVGLLAHSHVWKAENSTPRENIDKNLQLQDVNQAEHPRETLDFACVADIGTWHASRIAHLPPLEGLNGLSTSQQQNGYAASALVGSYEDNQPPSVAMFMTNLIRRLSYNDPLLEPLEESLRLTGTMGAGSGSQRWWELHEIFSDETFAGIRNGRLGSSRDWQVGYM